MAQSAGDASDVNELSANAWREMRRKMPCLHFDPVPETPTLVPRVREEEDGDGGNEDENTGVVVGIPVADTNATDGMINEDIVGPSNGDTGYTSGVTAASSIAFAGAVRIEEDNPSDDIASLSLHKHECSDAAMNPDIPMPSGSSGVYPLNGAFNPPLQSDDNTKLTAWVVPTALKKPSEGLDVARLEEEICSAQATLRHSIVAAVCDATATAQRDAELERRKLEAEYENRLAMQKIAMDELEETLADREKQHHQDSAMLERLSSGVILWKERERVFWRGPRSVRACFQAWRCRTAHEKQLHTLEQLGRQQQRKQGQQKLLQQWKLLTLQSNHDKQMEAQVHEHRANMENTVRDCNERVKQLQEQLENTRAEVVTAQNAQQKLEEDLRQLFLRGVSAMNMEALSLFRANHRPTDVSPHAQQSIDNNSASKEYRGGMDESPQASSSCPEPSTNEGGERGAAPGQCQRSAGVLPSEEQMIPARPPSESSELQAKLSSLLSRTSQPNKTDAFPSASMATRIAAAQVPSAGSKRSSLVPGSPVLGPLAPPTAAMHGLRSAELVEAHQRVLHATTSPHCSSSIATVLTSTTARLARQSVGSVKHDVDMEFMRSAVATAVHYGNTGTGPSRSVSGSNRQPLDRTQSFSTASATHTQQRRGSRRPTAM